MKFLKKLSLGVILATLMLMMCGISVSAATKNTTLKANTWAKQSGNGDQVYRKITIPSDGYITISTKQSGTNYIYVDVYDNSKKYLSEPIWTNKKTATATYAVAKGTYYLLGDSYDTFQYKYKFTKVAQQSNYCASKAVTLNAGKTATVVQTPMNSYDRWYKIKLTKSKSITYWVGGYYYNVTLYDSNFDTLQTVLDDEETGKYYTYKKLKKGTYYVRIDANYYYNKQARMSTFKWK